MENKFQLKHTGTTIINSKAVAKADEHFFTSEKAAELISKMADINWQQAYEKIRCGKHAKELTSQNICDFCIVSKNTHLSWSKVAPAKRKDLLNLVLAYGFQDSPDEVDYIFSRIVKISTPREQATLEDIAFLQICKNYDYAEEILPLVKSGMPSPFFAYLDLAQEFLDADICIDKFLNQKNILRFCKKAFPNHEDELKNYLSVIYDRTIKNLEEIRWSLKNKIDNFLTELNEKRKDQKKPRVSIHSIVRQNNLTPNFESVLSRFFKENSHNTLKRDYIISLGLHLGMNAEKIGIDTFYIDTDNRKQKSLLEINKMDPLSYKTPKEFILIFAIGQLEQKCLLDVDMEYEEIESIIMRNSELAAAFGSSYHEIAKEALKYFEGFKPKEKLRRNNEIKKNI